MNQVPPQAQLVVAALATMSELVRRGQDKRQQLQIAAMRIEALGGMVEAIVTRRVDVIERQCHQILSMYADQARSYIEEKKTFGDKLLEAPNPRMRTELNSRISDIDTRLAEIRAEARLVYDRMGELLIAVGGDGIGIPTDLSSALILPDPH